VSPDVAMPDGTTVSHAAKPPEKQAHSRFARPVVTTRVWPTARAAAEYEGMTQARALDDTSIDDHAVDRALLRIVRRQEIPKQGETIDRVDLEVA
jgi:hypothetical protein